MSRKANVFDFAFLLILLNARHAHLHQIESIQFVPSSRYNQLQTKLCIRVSLQMSARIVQIQLQTPYVSLLEALWFEEQNLFVQ